MKNKGFALLRVQLLGLFGLNRLLHSKDPREKSRNLLFAVGMALVVLIFVGYSALTAVGFAALGLIQALPPLMFAVSAVITLVTTVMKTDGVLFGFRDYDMVMSLPVSSRTVIASRFATLYLMNFLFSCILLIPMGVVYAVTAGAGPLALVMLFLCLFLSPLLPIVIATALGTLITAVSVRFRYKNLLVVVLSFVLILAVMAGSFGMSNTNMEELASLLSMASSMAASLYPPAVWYAGAAAGNVVDFLLVAGVSVGAFLLFVWVFSLGYTRINTALMSHRSGGNYQLGTLKIASPFRALYNKELRRLFTCPIYLMNTAIGSVILIVLGAASLFANVPALLASDGVNLPPGFDAGMITRYAPLVAAFCMALGSTTASSLSLEGKSRWIPLSAPVDNRTIFLSKIAVNLTVLLPGAFIGGILLAVGLHADAAEAVLLVAVPTVFAFFSSVVGMMANVKFPRYDWTSETAAVKQSAAVMVTILTGFGGMILTGAATFALGTVIDGRLAMALAALLLALICWFVYRRLLRIHLYM